MNSSEIIEINETPNELSLSFDEYFGNGNSTINESLAYANDSIDQVKKNFTWGGMGDTEYIFDRTDVRVIFFTMYTIVFCSCFFGNLMVILVVTLHWRMRSITNFCLANLAFADLCVGVFCVYQHIINYFENWIFGEFMCKMYHFINTLSHTASILILVVICIERYLAIIHPMRCKQMLTLNRLRLTIVMVWIISAVYSSPRFYYFKTVTMHLKNGGVEVYCIADRGKHSSETMEMFSMLLLFLLPLIVISVLYTHIGIVLWRSSQNKMPSASASESSSSSCRDYESNNATTHQTTRLQRAPSFYNRKMSMASAKSSLLCLNCPCVGRNTFSANKGTGNHNFPRFRRSCLMRNKDGAGGCETGIEMTASSVGGVGVPVVGSSSCVVGKSKKETDSPMKTQNPRNNTIDNEGLPRVNSISSIQKTSLCCGKLGYCSSHPLHKTGKGNVKFSHPPVSSPYLKRDAPTTISQAEPIVVVKFEKRKSSLRKRKGKRSRCMILMNTANTSSSSPKCVCRGLNLENRCGSDCATQCHVAEKNRVDCHLCLCREGNTDSSCPVPISVLPSSYSPNRSQAVKKHAGDCQGSVLIGKQSNIEDVECVQSNAESVSLNAPNISSDKFHSQTMQQQHCMSCRCHAYHHQHNQSTPSVGGSSVSLLVHNNGPMNENNGPPPSKGIKRMRVVRGSKYGTRALQSRRKIIRMLIVIVFAFAICNLPFHARKMWQSFGKSYQVGSTFSTLLTPITFLIMYSNSGINPILYAFMSKKFRLSFRDLLSCKLRRSLRMSRNPSLRSTHVIPMSTVA